MVERAMILGAGRGTRLGSLELTIPKVLVDIGGVPLLGRQAEYLREQGISRVVVNAHHLAEQVETFAQEYHGPIELIVVREKRLLGTAGGVRNALTELGSEPFLVLYGDVVVAEPLADLIAAHERSSAVATLTVYESDDVYGKGTVQVDGDGAVTGFTEKGESGAGTALVNAGVYVIEPEFVQELPLGEELDFGHDVFPNALARGVSLRAHRLADPVIDVGTPEGLARARGHVDGGREL